MLVLLGTVLDHTQGVTALTQHMQNNVAIQNRDSLSMEMEELEVLADQFSFQVGEMWLDLVGARAVQECARTDDGYSKGVGSKQHRVQAGCACAAPTVTSALWTISSSWHCA